MCSPSGHWKPGPGRWWLERLNFYTAHVLYILYMIFYIWTAPNRTTPGEHPFYQKINTWFRHPNTECCRTAWYAMSRDRTEAFGHTIHATFFLLEGDEFMPRRDHSGRAWQVSHVCAALSAQERRMVQDPDQNLGPDQWDEAGFEGLIWKPQSRRWPLINEFMSGTAAKI